jgi:excinuclease ABC subunit A
MKTKSQPPGSSGPSSALGIWVRRASEHNLKDVSVFIPRNKMTVITGVSGSGKSSLAFDTILC